MRVPQKILKKSISLYYLTYPLGLPECLPARPDGHSKVLISEEQHLGTGQGEEQAVDAGVARGGGVQLLVEQLGETETETPFIEHWILGCTKKTTKSEFWPTLLHGAWYIPKDPPKKIWRVFRPF